MATDTSKITGAADELSAGLTKGGTAAKTLGAEIANVFKALDARVTALEAGATTPPVEPPPEQGDEYGLIEGFNAASGSRFKVDGQEVSVQNANKSWSLKNPDDHTLTMEIHSGDTWKSGSYVDTGCNRSDLEWSQKISDGQELTVTELITIHPGSVTTASWMTIAALHSTVSSPPCPYGVGLQENTDKIQVVLQKPNTQNNNYIYTSPQPVVRGREMSWKHQMKMGPNGNGYVRVWLDGVQIVDYAGAVGANNSQYYWKTCCYRGEAREVMAITRRNIHVAIK